MDVSHRVCIWIYNFGHGGVIVPSDWEFDIGDPQKSAREERLVASEGESKHIRSIRGKEDVVEIVDAFWISFRRRIKCEQDVGECNP